MRHTAYFWCCLQGAIGCKLPRIRYRHSSQNFSSRHSSEYGQMGNSRFRAGRPGVRYHLILKDQGALDIIALPAESRTPVT